MLCNHRDGIRDSNRRQFHFGVDFPVYVISPIRARSLPCYNRDVPAYRLSLPARAPQFSVSTGMFRTGALSPGLTMLSPHTRSCSFVWVSETNSAFFFSAADFDQSAPRCLSSLQSHCIRRLRFDGRDTSKSKPALAYARRVFASLRLQRNSPSMRKAEHPYRRELSFRGSE